MPRSKKISELPEVEELSTSDFFPIVQVDDEGTKRVRKTTVQQFLALVGELGGGITSLTGDVVAAGAGAVAAALGSNVVTNSKLAQVASGILKGRLTEDIGNVEDIPLQDVIDEVIAQIPAFEVPLFSEGVDGVVPGPEEGDEEKFLRGDGTWAEVESGGGGIGGSTGSTDNAVLRADGTGGTTAKASNVTIDDDGNVIINNPTADEASYILLKNANSPNGSRIQQETAGSLRAYILDGGAFWVNNGIADWLAVYNGKVSTSGIGAINALADENLAFNNSGGNKLTRVYGALCYGSDNVDDFGISNAFSDTLRPRHIVAGTSLSVGATQATPPSAKAVLDLRSTTKGAFLPRMTTTEKNAMSLGTDDEGLEVFDRTLKKKCFWNGSAWETVTSA